MCPVFRIEPTEEASPRAKANLMRQLLQPDTDPRLLSSDDVRAVGVEVLPSIGAIQAHLRAGGFEALVTNAGEHVAGRVLAHRCLSRCVDIIGKIKAHSPLDPRFRKDDRREFVSLQPFHDLVNLAAVKGIGIIISHRRRASFP